MSRGTLPIWLLAGVLVACTSAPEKDPVDSDSPDSLVVDTELPPDTDAPDTDPVDTEVVDSDEPDTQVDDSEVDTDTDDSEAGDASGAPDSGSDDSPSSDTGDTADEPGGGDSGDSGDSAGGSPGDDTAVYDSADSDRWGDTAPDPVTMLQLYDGSVPLGTRVFLPGVAANGGVEDGLFVSDTVGGPHSGIFVYTGSAASATNVPSGRELVVVGILEELTDAGGGYRRIDASNGRVQELLTLSLPPPTVVTIAQLRDPAVAELYESATVRLVDARVVDELGIGLGATIGTADAFVVATEGMMLFGELHYGDTFDFLDGIVVWQGGEHRIQPRGLADLNVFTSFAAPANQLLEGDLVLTELMFDPADPACTAFTGQYVEILNTTAAEVDVDGLIVYSLFSDEQVQVREPLLIPAGGRVVGGAGGPGHCYGVPIDFDMDLALSVTGDFVGLFNSLTALDLGPILSSVPGVSVELSEGALDSLENDDLGNWCESTQPIPGASDLGSPGIVNSCP